MLVRMVRRPAGAGQPAETGNIQLDADLSVLSTLADVLDEFDPISRSSPPDVGDQPNGRGIGPAIEGLFITSGRRLSRSRGATWHHQTVALPW
jgi:hypothetical protein